MLRAVVAAATAAVTIAGTSFAYAQQRDDRPDGARRFQPTIEDMRAFQAARLAALRAGLMLTGDQERHWPAFEQAIQDIQQLRLARFTKMREARREGPPPAVDPAERMRQRATRMSESGAVLKRLADATEPLYRSLDDAQKRRFAILSRSGGPRGSWHRRGRTGGEPGIPRGQRRTDAAPIEAAPPVDLTFGRKQIDAHVIDLTFGSKLLDEEMPVFAGKTIDVAPAGPGGDVLPFGRKVIIGEGPTFSRKIIIGEPARFGRKTGQGI